MKEAPSNGETLVPRTMDARQGPLLSYNVPQQVAYSGDHYIELVLEPGDFLATASALETRTGTS
jgi:hypothetical protein